MALTATTYPGDQIYAATPQDGRLFHGEILAKVVHWLPDYDENSQVVGIVAMNVPLAVVLTQDCDLESDWRVRVQSKDPRFESELRSVLVCPATPDYLGIPHLSGKSRKPFQQNKNERFQFLAAIPPEKDLAGLGAPSVAVDFKAYFGMPVYELYRQIANKTCIRRSRLRTPWAEHLQCRFGSYLARIGLDPNHDADPPALG